MILASRFVDIKEDSEFGPNCLYFKFKGKFTEDASKISTLAWSQFMDENPGKSYSLVWDCLEMSGFEISARKKWYEYMKIYTGRIDHISVISGNILIRGAARVMLEVFGIKGVIAKSADALLEKVDGY